MSSSNDSNSEQIKQQTLQKISERVNLLNPQAVLQESTYSQTSLDFLIEKSVADVSKLPQSLENHSNCSSINKQYFDFFLSDSCHQHDHNNHHHSEDHSHKSHETNKATHQAYHGLIEGIQSLYFSLDDSRLLNFDKLEKQLGELLWEDMDGMHVMRCKGTFVALNPEIEQQEWDYILQGVENTFELRPISKTKKILQQQSSDSKPDEYIFKHRFLFIGKSLKEESIEQLISSCFNQ